MLLLNGAPTSSHFSDIYPIRLDGAPTSSQFSVARVATTVGFDILPVARLPIVKVYLPTRLQFRPQKDARKPLQGIPKQIPPNLIPQEIVPIVPNIKPAPNQTFARTLGAE